MNEIEFPYVKLFKNDKPRPRLPIKVQYRKGSEKVLALIDSGADFTFIPRHIASKVGLKLKPKNMMEVIGVGGKVDVYKTETTLVFIINDEEMALPRVTVLVPEESNFRHTLLGRDTIFREFRITFDEYNQLVTFERVYH